MLLEDPKSGRRGTGAKGRKVRINRRSGKQRARGWGATLQVDKPWAVTIDARDLARYIGNAILPEIRKSFVSNQDPETGASFPQGAEKRVARGWKGLRDPGGSNRQALLYLHKNLRRTWMGKGYPRGNRRINAKRALLKVYFSPGDRLGDTYPNPAAAFNKLMSMLDMDQLGLGGRMDRLVEDALDKWITDALSGRYLGIDTIDEAFGRRG